MSPLDQGSPEADFGCASNGLPFSSILHRNGGSEQFDIADRSPSRRADHGFLGWKVGDRGKCLGGTDAGDFYAQRGSSHCRSNLRQLSLGFIMYAGDYGGFLPPVGPPPGTWPGYVPTPSPNNSAEPIADLLRVEYFSQIPSESVEGHIRTAVSFNCPAYMKRSNIAREEEWLAEHWDPSNRHTPYQAMTSIMVNPKLNPGGVHPKLTGELINLQVIKMEEDPGKLMITDQVQYWNPYRWISNHLQPLHDSNQAFVHGGVTWKPWEMM